jgi:hypothetical protein
MDFFLIEIIPNFESVHMDSVPQSILSLSPVTDKVVRLVPNTILI